MEGISSTTYIQLIEPDNTYIPGRCTYKSNGGHSCHLSKDEHQYILDHEYQESGEGRFDVRNLTEKQRRYTLFSIIFLMFIFVGSSIFLVYDHVKYPGQTDTPHDIVVTRNICFVSMFISSILLCGGAGYYIYLNYHYETGIGSTVFVIVWITTYIVSAVFWLVYHIYYTVGKRHPSHAVHDTKMAAMIYVIVTTVIMMIFVCAQDPGACLVLCLLEH